LKFGGREAGQLFDNFARAHMQTVPHRAARWQLFARSAITSFASLTAKAFGLIAGAAENCNLWHAYLQNASDFNKMNSESFRESKVL
jgi:hypothetical protein